MNKLFSEILWDNCINEINAIKSMKFNTELSQGTLDHDKFLYYIKQDVKYLHNFSKCNALVANKLDQPKDIITFLQSAIDCYHVEQDIVHSYFIKNNKEDLNNLNQEITLTPACIGYTSYLVQVCYLESAFVAMASLLPCFWIYREVGVDIYNKSKNVQNNPYQVWIDTYSGEDFKRIVDNIVNIFNRLASNTTKEEIEKAKNVFKNSVIYEYHFWQDAYEMKKFSV